MNRVILVATLAVEMAKRNVNNFDTETIVNHADKVCKIIWSMQERQEKRKRINLPQSFVFRYKRQDYADRETLKLIGAGYYAQVLFGLGDNEPAFHWPNEHFTLQLPATPRH